MTVSMRGSRGGRAGILARAARACGALLACAVLVAGCEDEGLQAIEARLEASPSPFDFGPAPTGREARASIDLVSAGTGPVELRAIEITGPDAARFGFTAPELPLRLGAADRRGLELSFTPEAERAYEAELVVSSTDRRTPLRVALRGEGRAPTATVCDGAQTACAPAGDCLNLDFGRVVAGATSTRVALLRNEGEVDLEIVGARFEAGAAEAGFRALASLTGASIPAGGSVQIPLAFQGSQQGAVESRLTLDTNDPVHPEACVLLAGEGPVNAAPHACAAVTELVHADGRREVPPAGSTVLARIGDRLLLTAHPEAGCSGDAEDGEVLRYHWWIPELPEGSGAFVGNPGAGPAPGRDEPPPWIDLDAPGRYQVQLVVKDALGLGSDPAILDLEVVPPDDLVVELVWDEPADLDLHVIAPGGQAFCATLDCFWDTCLETDSGPSLDWGPDTDGDGKPDPDGDPDTDPRLTLDQAGAGGGPQVERLRLARTRVPGNHRVAVHYFEGSAAPAAVSASVRIIHRGAVLLEASHTFAPDALGTLWTAGEFDPLTPGAALVDTTAPHPDYRAPQTCQ